MFSMAAQPPMALWVVDTGSMYAQDSTIISKYTEGSVQANVRSYHGLDGMLHPRGQQLLPADTKLFYILMTSTVIRGFWTFKYLTPCSFVVIDCRLMYGRASVQNFESRFLLLMCVNCQSIRMLSAAG